MICAVICTEKLGFEGGALVGMQAILDNFHIVGIVRGSLWLR